MATWTQASRKQTRFSALYLLLALICSIGAAPAMAGETGPDFDKAFLPDTIGPGSVSMLTFTIDNANSSEPVNSLAFVDVFPFGMTLAAPGFVSNTCDGTVTAVDGGNTVTLTDGLVGAFQTCEIVVNVIGTTDCGGLSPDGLPECDNVTGDLTSSAGNSGTAADILFVDSGRPGFSKSFAPSSVAFGGRSTLTFTIDNSANPGFASPLSFVDLLPAGMVIADPTNASSDCDLPGAPVITAVSGTDLISLFGGGVDDGETCTVVVDVIGAAVGQLGNVSGELTSGAGGGSSSGKAAAVLEVTGPEDPLTLTKEFTDDPVAPGGTVTLEFTVTNQDRDFPATGLTFDDDIEATLTGLAPSGGLPTDPCGSGSSLSFSTGVLTLNSGVLPAEGACTFSVGLDVPSGSTPAAYPNTTTAISGTIDGSPETGNTASDLLFVVSFPVLTKEFTDDPVGAGGSVTLEFTVFNPETASTMSAITFIDELTDGSGDGGASTGFLPFPVSVTLPPVPDPPCGAGSALALVSAGTDRQALALTGGDLAASDGTPGGPDTCTFEVTIDIPAGFPSGTYTNTTGEITGVLDDLPGPPTALGPPASDDIVIAGAPGLTKEFVDDPVLPAGGPVTLEFNLTHDESASGDATGIAFTDDLAALSPTIPGLVAASVDTNTCPGATVDISTPTLIDFSGGTLMPGETCAVILTLTVPAGAPVGFHTNSTSDVTAMVGGLLVTGNGPEDDLLITPMVFTKEFVGDPTIAGDTVDLTFTLENLGASLVTGISFTDSLTAAIPGLAVSGPLPPTPCGPGSSITGTTSLIFSGGEVAATSTCSFTVELLVPAGTPDDTYMNITSPLSTSVGTLPAAVAGIVVQSELLELTKEFTDDPVVPGGTVTLEFNLDNLSGSDTVTDIAFDDDLDATLSGLVLTSELLNECGGSVSGIGTGLFEYAGGSLGASASCTVRLSLTLPGGSLAGSIFPNTTTDVTGLVGALDVNGSPASDDLVVQSLTLTKAFDGPTVAGGTAVLTFTLDNLDSTAGVIGLAFSDDLDAVLSGLTATVLPPAPVCGTGTVAGVSFLTLTGASLDPSGSCSFEVTVTVPAPAPDGSFLNTTSGLSQEGLPAADPATALLEIEPPPAFSKTFVPDSIPQGGVSTLVFTIDNTASALEATSLDFTDNLPAAIAVASPANASTTCTGGTITATPGTAVVSYTGGTVGAGASCEVEADVTSSVVGSHVNVTGELTSSSGNSGTATDTLDVFDAVPPEVTLVDSIMGTGDGELEECETARTRVDALTVTFDEVMFAPNDTDPNSVTNPANWLVVGSGPDQDLSTTVCGALQDDDVAAAIDEVTWAGGSLTATVAFDESLADGPVRLIACSGGMTDPSFNALDGDGDGTGGDDFVRTFRVDRIDAFANGNFDCSLDDWVPASGGSGVSHSPDDVDNAAISGSAFFDSAGSDLALGQCIGLLPESIYEFSGYARLDTAGVTLDVIRSCELFTSSDCTGTGLPAQAFFSQLTLPGVWEPFVNELGVPTGVNSGLCQIDLRNLGGMPWQAHVDDLSMDAIFTMILFRDGFESGDTSAWSSTVP